MHPCLPRAYYYQIAPPSALIGLWPPPHARSVCAPVEAADCAFSDSSAAQSHNVMKYVCAPGRVWPIRRRLWPGQAGDHRLLPLPWPPAYRLCPPLCCPPQPPHPAPTPTCANSLARSPRIGSASSTPPQRDAWTAFARNCHRRWGAVWSDYARQLNCRWPDTLTAYHRRMIRWWLEGARPLNWAASLRQAQQRARCRLGSRSGSGPRRCRCPFGPARSKQCVCAGKP